MNVDLALEYLEFVTQRHLVWERRQAGEPAPWTDNSIVATRKFTNVYRVLDFGSQYVGRLLHETDDHRERLFRAFLYRHTGRPEPWDFFEAMEGRPPLLSDLLDGSLKDAWHTYRGAGVTNQRVMFTGAYLVFPQSQVRGTDKLDSILDLARRVMEGPAEAFLGAATQQARFAALRVVSGVGDFMAMQVLTDIGYTTEDREDDFVVAGPGARKGAAHLAPERKPLEVCHWAHRELRESGISITLPDGRERTPSLMDAQNTLCEFSKYVRYMSAKGTGSYTPAHPGRQPEPWLPPLW